MRSATLVEPRQFRIDSVDLPEPGEGEVRIRVRGCGVCGSDMGPWKGFPGMAYPLQPGAPGHEAFGTVEAVGPGVQGLAAGQAVTALTYQAYAEYDLARADSVISLPGTLADRPVLGEPIACAVNVMRRSGVREGDTVVLLGTGFLGTLLIQLLRRYKPSRVVAVSRRRMDPGFAERLGVEVLTYQDDIPGGADVVIEATGKQGPLDLATNLVRVRGRLIVAGYHQDGPRTVNMQLWNWNGIDVINAHERDPAVYRSGMEEGVRLLAAGEIDLEPLITHTFPLADIGQAFRMTEERLEGFLKSVVLADG